MAEIPSGVKTQIDRIAEKCAGIKPLVVINCITYNHEAFLREALEGFVSQQADFPFVAIVHDDASTDGTAAILRQYADRYPDIILPIYEEKNQYSNGSLGLIMHTARNATGAEYVALCEGDDYWTDPLKLQKQVDFLTSHPDYSMCHTAFDVVDEYSNRLSAEYLDEKIEAAKRAGNVDEYLMTFYRRSKERLPRYQSFMKESCSGERFWFLLVKHNYIITATCMMRIAVSNESRRGYYDYGLFLTAARMGKIGYLPDLTTAYRFQPNSAMTNSKLYNEIIRKREALNNWGEIERIYNSNTMPEILSRTGAKKMLVRKIFGMWFNAPEFRKKYFLFVMRHSELWFDMANYCIWRTPKIEEIYNISE